MTFVYADKIEFLGESQRDGQKTRESSARPFLFFGLDEDRDTAQQIYLRPVGNRKAPAKTCSSRPARISAQDRVS